MESADTKLISSEFNLKEKEIQQAYSFQNVVTEEFIKLDPSKTNLDFYTDIDNVTRFLIARDFKVPKALEMWKKWYNWRITYRADAIQESEIENELKSGKAFWYGRNKLNHPCLIVKTRRHFPSESSVDQTIRFGVYTIEKGVNLMKEVGTSQVCVIWDREGFDQKKNFDKSILTVMKQLVGILQDFYAERLEQVYILKPNWFFKMIFGLIKPFLSDKTKNKVKLINKNEELLNYFEPENLLQEYGGASKFEYSWPPDSSPIKDYFVSATSDDIEDENIEKEIEKESKDLLN